MSWIRKTVPFVRRSSGAMAASSPTMISENLAALMAFDSEVGKGEGRIFNGSFERVPTNVTNDDPIQFVIRLTRLL